MSDKCSEAKIVSRVKITLRIQVSILGPLCDRVHKSLFRIIEMCSLVVKRGLYEGGVWGSKVMVFRVDRS